MKASLFAEDEEESEMFQDHGAMKVAPDVSSPRIILPGTQSRSSGRKHKPPLFPTQNHPAGPNQQPIKVNLCFAS